MPYTRSSGPPAEAAPYPDLEPVIMHRNSLKERKKKGWPTVWRRRGHPQWLPGVDNTRYRKEAFVYICDTTEEGMKESLDLGANMEAPGHGDEEIEKYGRFDLF